MQELKIEALDKIQNAIQIQKQWQKRCYCHKIRELITKTIFDDSHNHHVCCLICCDCKWDRIKEEIEDEV
jgi:hypothetical protein